MFTPSNRRVVDVWVVVTAIKLLLFHAYKSTDFEVHRNWMALTYEKNFNEWYFEKTSEWTLDYPPFFAYFEWFLAQVAAFVDPEMLKVQNLYYNELSVIFYQRATVIFSDLVFIYACFKYFKAIEVTGKIDYSRFIFNYVNFGLIILDNIHFQYNSMMYGIMILSIAFIREKAYFKSALMFAILLNFKHIYLYCAPCFGIFYLKKLVFNKKRGSFLNFILLGLQTLAVFAISMGPIILTGQLQQMISRLFPFQRGLVHYYWAANIWALYMFFHKYAVNIYQGLTAGTKIQCIYIEGDLEVYKLWSLAATLLFLVPLILSMFMKLNKRNFNFYLAATNFVVFNFGFHVHEKAILMTIIPLMLDASSQSDTYSKIRLLILKTIAIWTFLPLIVSMNDTFVKHMIFLTDTFLTLYVFLQIQFQRVGFLLRSLTYSMFGLIFAVQAWYLYIEYLLDAHEGWMHRYQDLLPTIASLFNQMIFIDMMVRCFIGMPDTQSKKKSHVKIE